MSHHIEISVAFLFTTIVLRVFRLFLFFEAHNYVESFCNVKKRVRKKCDLLTDTFMCRAQSSYTGHRDSNPAPISMIFNWLSEVVCFNNYIAGDSDPEFAAGPYENENDTKKKKKKKKDDDNDKDDNKKKDKRKSKKINKERDSDYSEPPSKKRKVEEVDSSGDERPAISESQHGIFTLSSEILRFPRI